MSACLATGNIGCRWSTCRIRSRAANALGFPNDSVLRYETTLRRASGFSADPGAVDLALANTVDYGVIVKGFREGQAMRMPRITIRGLMVVVAMVALSLASYGLIERAIACRKSVRYHSFRAERIRTRLPWPEEIDRYYRWNSPEATRFMRGTMALGTDPEHDRAMLAHHEFLRRKYEYAASHPWLLIEPDPPAPE
jgi:hypothetical protein